MRAFTLLSLLMLTILSLPAPAPAAKPNIVLMLADDLGWGDVGCYNALSKIPTPHLDRLALEGICFTDAHSSSGVCVPSRFSLMTGRHAFRLVNPPHPEPELRQKYGGNQPTTPLIPADAPTLAGTLRKGGYATSMVGKWHLGFDDLLRKPDQRLRGGPTDRGFDRYFGIPSSLDYGPYILIEDDRVVARASETMAAGESPGWPKPFMGAFWRADLAAPGFRHADVLPDLTRRAEAEVARLAKRAKERPFFLYYALPAPHSPLMPTKEFNGRARLPAFGSYGDYVAQTDDAIGRVLKAIKEAGVERDTLVIVTSDNGPLWYPKNAEETGHSASGSWRGMKGDAWEGGHRMPLIMRWPGRVTAGGVSAATVSLTDIPATIAAIAEVHEDAFLVDATDFLPAIRDREWQRPADRPLLVRSSLGANVLRIGPWKLIDRLGSGGFSTPASEKASKDGPTVQLYDLATDPAETNNRANQDPERVARMRRLLEDLLSGGR